MARFKRRGDLKLECVDPQPKRVYWHFKMDQINAWAKKGN